MEYTDTLDDDFMPVFLINGFLEAGKTQFLQFTMQQDYFQTDGKTLLIVCEDGDTEYDTELLKRTKTAGIFIESMDELTPERLLELELLYNPERVLIEWNGMWNQDDLQLPDDWRVYQQITIIDMSTFDLYVANMKPLNWLSVTGVTGSKIYQATAGPLNPCAREARLSLRIRRERSTRSRTRICLTI